MQENYLDTALASLPVQADVGGVLKYSGIVRTVLAKLKDQGVVAGNWAEVLQITLLVLDAIQQLGPLVEEIVAKVKELWGK